MKFLKFLFSTDLHVSRDQKSRKADFNKMSICKPICLFVSDTNFMGAQFLKLIKQFNKTLGSIRPLYKLVLIAFWSKYSIDGVSMLSFSWFFQYLMNWEWIIIKHQIPLVYNIIWCSLFVNVNSPTSGTATAALLMIIIDDYFISSISRTNVRINNFLSIFRFN